MRPYEVVYIIDPQLEEEQQTALIERFQKLIGDQGGEVQHVDRWERRRMAYEINGRREGFYVVVNFSGAPSVEAELGRVLGITEGVLRHLIVRLDDRRAEKKIAEARAAAAAKARAQEEARAAAQAAAAAVAQAEPAPQPAAPAPQPTPAVPPAPAPEPEPEPEPEPKPATADSTAPEGTQDEGDEQVIEAGTSVEATGTGE